jgi:hypothetical protein
MRGIVPSVGSEVGIRPEPATLAEAARGALIAVKALIVCTTVTALAVPGMHEFRGEAMAGRVLVYAVAVLVIPAAWLMFGRRSYPVAADSFLMVPVAFDLAGNSLHLYARFDHYDKVAHLVGLAATAMFAAALLPICQRPGGARGGRGRRRARHRHRHRAVRVRGVHAPIGDRARCVSRHRW